MLLDLKDFGISRHLALEGEREVRSTAEIKKLMKPGMIIAEVGANIGYYALMEADAIGPTGKIYAFEPNPDPRSILKINIALNDFQDRIEVLSDAMSNKIGKSDFFISECSNLGNMVHGTDKIEVSTTTIDTFFRNKKMDFLRMDVEGFEINIMKGAKKYLTSSRAPKHIFVEIHPKLLKGLGSSKEEFLKLMNSYGYKLRKAFLRGWIEVNTEEDFNKQADAAKFSSKVFFTKI